ncbi:MAG: sugar phosphate isomerase/epimerase [Candidatus Bathyarchaeota archaeon]|nr:MAG: sugar phosphate isomerase/epimerase [Candidatus Bathyarchaeota archaeon]
MSKPKIGLSTLFCLGEPFNALVKRLYEVDVSYVELVDEGLHRLDKKRIKVLKVIAQSKDLDLMLHSPFADINIASSNSILRKTVLKIQKESLIHAYHLDCQVWVFHPGLRTGVSYFYPERDWQHNLESVRTLLKVAGEYGVNIAIENGPSPLPFLMRNVEDFSRFYNELGEDIGLTFDVAHANLDNQIPDFVMHLSDRIIHVHVSDNDGISDAHLGIGYGKIDWKTVAETIKEVSYNNIIVLESMDHVEESLQKLRKLFA